jgi:hypothetical protein
MEESAKCVKIESSKDEDCDTAENRLMGDDRSDEETIQKNYNPAEKDTIKPDSCVKSENLTFPVSNRAKASFLITDILSPERTRVPPERGEGVVHSEENAHQRLDLYSRVGRTSFNTETFDELVKRKYDIKRSYDDTDLVSEPSSPASQSERKNLWSFLRDNSSNCIISDIS